MALQAYTVDIVISDGWERIEERMCKIAMPISLQTNSLHEVY
jgi:hypothetical protein